MAIGSTAVWEVRTTGNDANGGFYTSGGTDYSQQDSAQLSVTDGVTNGTTTVTSATGGFTAAMIGNGINIAGTIYEITARASTNSITVDRTTGTASGQTMKVGGALASPGKAGGSVASGNDVYIKSGTYSITSSSSNVSVGVVSLNSGGDSGRDNHARWVGYGATRNDGGTKPVIQASGISSVDIVTMNGQNTVLENVEIDGNLQTSIRGIRCSGNPQNVLIRRCKVRQCTNDGISCNTGNTKIVECEVTGCTTAGVGIRMASTNGVGDFAFGCYVHGNSVPGFSGGAAAFCVASGNTGIGFDGPWLATNCTAYGNTSDGFFWDTNTGNEVRANFNLLAVGNGGYGFRTNTGVDTPLLINFAHYNNTSGGTHGNITRTIAGVTLTGDPFTNAGSGDFSLNNTAGAGAACRAAGIPGAFPGGTTTGYLDIGAAQHQDAGGGGTVIVIDED